MARCIYHKYVAAVICFPGRCGRCAPDDSTEAAIPFERIDLGPAGTLYKVHERTLFFHEKCPRRLSTFVKDTPTTSLYRSLPRSQAIIRTSAASDKMPGQAAGESSRLKALLKFGYGLTNFVLSLVNALSHDFEFDKFKEFIFSTSAVMEGVGIVYALCSTDWGNFILGANPLTTVWKAMGSGDSRSMTDAVFGGFAAQASAVWLCFIGLLFTAGIGGVAAPTAALVFSTTVVGKVIWNNSNETSADSSIEVVCFKLLKFAALLAPAAIELIEGALLVTDSDSDTRTYIQAVVDFFQVLFAIPFIAVFLCNQME